MPTDVLEAKTSLPPVPLSQAESFFWKFEEDCSGAFRILVLIRLDGFIEEAPLRAALSRLQQRHPKLQSVIRTAGNGRLHYILNSELPPIPLEVVDWHGDAQTPWRETTRRLLKTSFPEGMPKTAVCVVRSRAHNFCELFFMTSHAIADGMSGLMLVNDLLTEYARVETKSDLEPATALRLLSIPRAKSPTGWRSHFRLLRRYRRLRQQQTQRGLTELPVQHNIPPQSQWEHWVFSPEQTLAMIKRCRKERTSINGVMVAAVCCGLRDCLSLPEALFKWQLPFNLREFLHGPAGPVTPHDLGCFVSNMNGLQKLSEGASFWEVAQSVHQEVQMFIQEGGPSFGYNVASVLTSLVAWALWNFKRQVIKGEHSTEQRETLLATNYGVVDFSDSYGSLRPRDCTLMFQNEITGPSLVMEALVLCNRMNIGFAADDLDPAFWNRLHQAVRGYFEMAIRGTS